MFCCNNKTVLDKIWLRTLIVESQFIGGNSQKKNRRELNLVKIIRVWHLKKTRLCVVFLQSYLQGSVTIVRRVNCNVKTILSKCFATVKVTCLIAKYTQLTHFHSKHKHFEETEISFITFVYNNVLFK